MVHKSTKRTRYTCPSSGDLVVASMHMPNHELACPLCGRRVIVTDEGKLPAHNYRTKAEMRVIAEREKS